MEHQSICGTSNDSIYFKIQSNVLCGPRISGRLLWRAMVLGEAFADDLFLGRNFDFTSGWKYRVQTLETTFF